ncbi:MAG: hypothetical protein ACLQG3_19770 [Terracidiphilus sp.]
MSLEVKQVIDIARVQFKELLSDLALDSSRRPGPPAPKKGIPPPPRPGRIDIRLEELEKEGNNWAVTLSIPNPDYNPQALLHGIRNARNLARIAKVIVIDGEEGKLVALRERAA